MIVPPDIRIENYTEAMAGERIPANVKTRLDQMVSQFSTYAERIYQKEVATHALLVASNVPARLYFYYQAFMREALARYETGEPSQIQAAIAKWAVRGLQPSIMQKIVDEILPQDTK